VIESGGRDPIKIKKTDRASPAGVGGLGRR